MKKLLPIWIIGFLLFAATWAYSANSTNSNITGISTGASGDITVTSVTVTGGTATTVPYFDSSKILTSSAVTPTELGYVSGVTSAIQTQLTAKAPLASPSLTGTVTVPGGTIGATGISLTQIGTSIVPLTITKVASGTANLTEWYDSTPTLQAWVKNGGTIEAASFRVGTDLAGFTNDQWLNPTYATNMNWGAGSTTSAWQLAGRNTSQAFKAMFEIQSNKSTNVGLLIQPNSTNTANNIEARNSSAVLLYSVTGTGAVLLVGKTADPCADTTGFPADSTWQNTTNHVLCTCVAGVSKRASDGSTSCF